MNPFSLVPAPPGFLDWVRRKKKPIIKDEYWTTKELHKAILRNGNIIGRALIEHRSLSYEERQIITAVRRMALEVFSQKMIDIVEMDGIQDREVIHQPIRVIAKFAYYNSGEYGWAPQPSYHITESNHPALPLHGNVGKEELEKNNIKVPKTPTFEDWDRQGRPVFRG